MVSRERLTDARCQTIGVNPPRSYKTRLRGTTRLGGLLLVTNAAPTHPWSHGDATGTPKCPEARSLLLCPPEPLQLRAEKDMGLPPCPRWLGLTSHGCGRSPTVTLPYTTRQSTPAAGAYGDARPRPRGCVGVSPRSPRCRLPEGGQATEGCRRLRALGHGSLREASQRRIHLAPSWRVSRRGATAPPRLTTAWLIRGTPTTRTGVESEVRGVVATQAGASASARVRRVPPLDITRC
jgi:hypothetical protein